MGVIDEKQSLSIWNMKAFAVVAIVACHCCWVREDAGIVNQVTTAVLNYWIGYGVPIFYFLSGYLFKCEKNILQLLKKKAIAIGIPWLVTGTGVWLYVVLRKGGISWVAWFRYLFLRESYLYFLTNLCICFLVFYSVKKYRRLRYVVSAYFGIGIFLQSLFNINVFIPFQILELPIDSALIFFLGILTREHDVLRRFKYRGWSLMLPLFVLMRYLQIHGMVPSNLSFVISTIAILSLVIGLYSISYWIAEKRIKWILEVGKYSFSIYLLHMPAAGVIAWLLNKSEVFAVLTIWRPFIVIAITMGLIKVYERLVRKKKNLMILIGKR